MGYVIAPTLRDCRFLENVILVGHSNSDESLQWPAGISAVYANLYDINFQGYNKFENNSGSSQYVINGIANFTNSHVGFVNNTGLQAGAVILIEHLQ